MPGSVLDPHEWTPTQRHRMRRLHALLAEAVRERLARLELARRAR